MKKKILTLDKFARTAKKLRAAGKRIVATNGCFDLLHAGHIKYLRAASRFGDILAVGLNSDRSVRELKGPHRPIHKEKDRAEVLAALQDVDFVVTFREKRATRFLKAAAPAVYVKGGDYTCETLDTEEREVLDRMGSEIRFVRFQPGYSTSTLIEQLRGTPK
jgi:rfaE bifunctional protein nucleotidyltransferase chain/domain